MGGADELEARAQELSNPDNSLCCRHASRNTVPTAAAAVDNDATLQVADLGLLTHGDTRRALISTSEVTSTILALVKAVPTVLSTAT